MKGVCIMYKNQLIRSCIVSFPILLLLTSCVEVVNITGHNPWRGIPNSELIVAVHMRQTGKVRSILKKRPELVDLEVQGETPLEVAAINHDVEIAKILLDHGADVNRRLTGFSTMGPTPLHEALSRARSRDKDPYDTVVLLLDHGADINLLEQGYTVLHLAARGSSVRVLELLHARGAAVDARTPEGWTPLMTAASKGWYAGVRYFLENGADPLAVNQRGDTALFEANFTLHNLERRGNLPEMSKEMRRIAARLNEPDLAEKTREARRVVALLKEHEERKKKEREGAQ